MRSFCHSVLIALLFIGTQAPAQRVVDVDKDDVTAMSSLFFVLGGEPFSLARYVKVVEGSAFFNPDWMRGTLIIDGGKKYDSVYIKLDLLADEVHYKDKAGNELIATSRIREIWLIDSVTNKKFHFVHSRFIGTGTIAGAGWYQMLVDGTAILFKKHQKEVLETKPYGSATYEQRISTASRYFILFRNTFTPVKSLSSIPGLLDDKKSQLEEFISTNRLKGKSEGDFISLVSYYNSLVPK